VERLSCAASLACRGILEIPQHIERERDGDCGTDQDESPADGFSMGVGQTIGHEKPDSGPKDRPGSDEHGKIRQAKLSRHHG
jgi:hypothetical protein